MRCFKILAGFLLLLLSAVLVIGCASVRAPADADAAKSRILDCGWDLSYTEDAGDLSDLVGRFDFDREGGLTAYLIAKDADEITVLEVLFFESERDAEAALTMLAGQLPDSSTYGRSGCQIWYGQRRAVGMYLE